MPNETKLKIGFTEVDTFRLSRMCADIGAIDHIQLIAYALTFYETCINETKKGKTIVSLMKETLEYDIAMAVIPIKPDM